MKLFKLIILVISLSNPIHGFAQKAYETIYYKGIVNEMPIKFSLADGYLGASEIYLEVKHTKARNYQPEKGGIDAKGQLKFLSYTHPLQPVRDYFLIYQLKEDYDVLPLQLSGKYQNGDKQYNFILKKQN